MRPEDFIAPASTALVGLELVHFSLAPLMRIDDRYQDPTGRDIAHQVGKPRGLWVSVEGGDDSWSAWCRLEGHGLDRLHYANRVTLKPNADVVRLRDAHQIDEFTRVFGRMDDSYFDRLKISWHRIAEIADAIVIAPYVWSRRLHPDSRWYYGWDCASGCIWDANCVASIDVTIVGAR